MAAGASDRLDTLDAMRGVAALMVVVHHLGLLAGSAAPVGYLAVDFFFVLSGFVLSRAYDDRLAKDLSAGKFMQLRLVRLYPIYFAGLVLGFMVAGARIVAHEEHALTSAMLGASTMFGALMLPTPGAPDALYPLNFPAWSLFLELVASACYGLLALRFGVRALIIVVCASAIGVALGAAAHGTVNVGDIWATFGDGLVRTAFSFAAGVLIQRLSTGKPVRVSAWCVAPAIALVVTLAARPSAAWVAAYDVLFVLMISPALVAVGARFEPPAQARPAAQFLGEISYPLYAIHMPLIYMTGFVATKLGLPALVWVPLYCVGVVVAAFLLSRLYDRPVRAWITDRLRDARHKRLLALRS